MIVPASAIILAARVMPALRTVLMPWPACLDCLVQAKAPFDIESSSSTKGQGNIDRSEKIQLSVAAVVTDVLGNGNLLISGSQEIRVNYELRNLTIGGIVRPRDIGRDNMISYDKIAEARVSYGGRGRLMEVQQPGIGQQVYDLVRPF